MLRNLLAKTRKNRQAMQRRRLRHLLRVEGLEQRRVLTTIGFDPPITEPVGDRPASVITADLNGDGSLDLATANASFSADDVSVLLNNGDGTFATSQDFDVGRTPLSVTAGDLNGDGNVDLVTANQNSDNVSVLLGNGDGTFAAAQNFAAGDGPQAVTTGDFDDDGDLDLAVATDFSFSSGSVSVLVNDGSGSFTTAQQLTVGEGARSVATGDLDGDGTPDLVTANSFSDNVSVLLNNGDGTFAAAQHLAVWPFPVSVTLGDLDGDGNLDLATASRSSGTSSGVTVRSNTGDGTFAAAQNFGAGSSPESITTSDLDRDGNVDLAIANRSSDDVSVLVNNGDGTFAAAQDFDVGSVPQSVTTGDLDSDGGSDLVTANTLSSDVSILLNTTELPNKDPIADDDSYEVDEDNPLTRNVLDNDRDPDGDDLSVGVVTGPSSGTLTLDGNTGSFEYVPDANFNGQDSFVYEVSDGHGGTDTATVNITVNSVIDAQIDVKPGGSQNPVNLKSKGLLPVAVLSTQKASGELEDFDATTVDTDTIKLNGFDVDPVHAAFEDVDGDGDLDLMLHFRMPELVDEGVLDENSVDLALTAEYAGGDALGADLGGSDSIRIVPSNGNGNENSGGSGKGKGGK